MTEKIYRGVIWIRLNGRHSRMIRVCFMSLELYGRDYGLTPQKILLEMGMVEDAG